MRTVKCPEQGLLSSISQQLECAAEAELWVMTWSGLLSGMHLKADIEPLQLLGELSDLTMRVLADVVYSIQRPLSSHARKTDSARLPAVSP
jgi:hypothetical protein